MIERVWVGRPANERGELLPFPFLEKRFDLCRDVGDTVLAVCHVT